MGLLISFKFNESFIKSCDKNNDRGYFLEVDAEYQKKKKKKKKLISIKIFRFYQKERKSKNVISLFTAYKIKKLCCSHKSFKASIKSWINTKKITQSSAI